MKRRRFLAGLASAAVAPATVRASAPFPFSGELGVYAEFVGGGAPFADVRGERPFSAASVIKLLIAVGAMAKASASSFSLDHPIAIPGRDVVGASESFGSARAGSFAALGALCSAMISQSDNTAANALLDWVGQRRLDDLAIDLGLTQTRLHRHFMDFAARAAGRDNVTCARDMAALAKGIAIGTARGYGGASAWQCRYIYGRMLRQEDRELIPAAIVRPATIANKTGELIGVRHDVAIVDLGKPRAYVVALLSEGWSSRSAATLQLRAAAAEVDRLARGITRNAAPRSG